MNLRREAKLESNYVEIKNQKRDLSMAIYLKRSGFPVLSSGLKITFTKYESRTVKY